MGSDGICRLVESFGGGFEEAFCAYAFFVEGVLGVAWRVLRPCSRLMASAFSPESTQGKKRQARKTVLMKIRSHIFPAVRLLAVLLHRCFKGAFFMGLQNVGGFMGMVDFIPKSNDRLGVMNQAALISFED